MVERYEPLESSFQSAALLLESSMVLFCSTKACTTNLGNKRYLAPFLNKALVSESEKSTNWPSTSTQYTANVSCKKQKSESGNVSIQQTFKGGFGPNWVDTEHTKTVGRQS